MIKVSGGLIFFVCLFYYSQETSSKLLSRKLSGRSPRSLGSSHWFFLGPYPPTLSRLLGGWANRDVSCGSNAEPGATLGAWRDPWRQSRVWFLAVDPNVGEWKGGAWLGEGGSGEERGELGAGGRYLVSGGLGWEPRIEGWRSGGRGVGPWESRVVYSAEPVAAATHDGSVLMSTGASVSPKPPTLLEFSASDSGFKS